MTFPQQQSPRLTAEEFEVRIWGFVVVMVTIILFGIVFSLLYSVTFVTQPIKSMAPIDMAYTKMLNDIVLLIVGGIGGVIGKKGVGAAVNAIQSTIQPPPAPVAQAAPTVNVNPPTVNSSMPSFNWMGYTNPDLDEKWTPPPPPTTPPDHMESDEERALLAAARKETS